MINELRSKLSDKDGQLAVKESIIKNLEMKVTEYENINAACEDVEEEIAHLRAELEQERNERKRAEENAKASLVESSTSILKYNHELKALKELLRLYL